ncbi:MAG: 5-formyltetrahydrofolate cyclo-ligase [Salinivirgaceae bacterium]|nr:5-formyltetrahydrofolate cyclo-ligase [Salinivirgaceae bacterium]
MVKIYYIHHQNRQAMNGQITILDKPSLRRMVGQLKKLLTEGEKQRQVDSVFAQIEQLQQFKATTDIAVYWSLDDEIDTHRFIEKWFNRKRLWLPVVVGDDLIFKQFEGADKMTAGAFGILEPTGRQLDNVAQIGLIIVPGVAFDLQNNRMGRGRGFYDRLLANSRAYKIGIAYSCQIFNQIPTEETDIPMDLVVGG